MLPLRLYQFVHIPKRFDTQIIQFFQCAFRIGIDDGRAGDLPDLVHKAGHQAAVLQIQFQGYQIQMIGFRLIITDLFIEFFLILGDPGADMHEGFIGQFQQTCHT